MKSAKTDMLVVLRKCMRMLVVYLIFVKLNFIQAFVFGRPFVNRFALCYQTVVCPVIYYGQTVGRIKMKLGKQVGLGPDQIVLDRDLVPLPKWAQPPIFGLYLLWANDRMDQDATWHGGRPRPRRLC